MEKAMAGGVKQWLAAFRLLLSRSFESGSTASRFDAFLHSYWILDLLQLQPHTCPPGL